MVGSPLIRKLIEITSGIKVVFLKHFY